MAKLEAFSIPTNIQDWLANNILQAASDLEFCAYSNVPYLCIFNHAWFPLQGAIQYMVC